MDRKHNAPAPFVPPPTGPQPTACAHDVHGALFVYICINYPSDSALHASCGQCMQCG